jgi:hypothetical protein
MIMLLFFKVFHTVNSKNEHKIGLLWTEQHWYHQGCSSIYGIYYLTENRSTFRNRQIVRWVEFNWYACPFKRRTKIEFLSSLTRSVVRSCAGGPLLKCCWQTYIYTVLGNKFKNVHWFSFLSQYSRKKRKCWNASKVVKWKVINFVTKVKSCYNWICGSLRKQKKMTMSLQKVCNMIMT